MTGKQREELVEVLRCAADDLMSHPYGWGSTAIVRVTCKQEPCRDALLVYDNVCGRLRLNNDVPHGDVLRDLFHRSLLEAALLVEEGVLP